MPSMRCKACDADNREELEALGLQCISGEMSWREAERQGGYPRQSLLNHMEKHYVNAVVREAEDEMDGLILDAVAELRASMKMAPTEVKPLYAAAIVNLRGLQDTKPSQQHLITALKTIQEMTGMRQEQRMMLSFIDAMEFAKPAVSVPARPMLVENLADSKGGE